MTDLKPPFQKIISHNRHFALWWMLKRLSKKESSPLQTAIDDLALANNTIRFEEHLTLLGLLNRMPAELYDIKAFAKDLAQKTKPFAAEITGVGFRAMHTQAVFLPVVPTETLVSAFARADNRFNPQNQAEVPVCMPHFSLVYGDLSQERRMVIAQDFQRRYAWSFPYYVDIARLAVVDVDGQPDEWKVISDYPLIGK